MNRSSYSFTDYVERDEFAEILDEASSGLDVEYTTDQIYDEEEVTGESVLDILTKGIKRFNPNRYLQGDE